jgi:hypothetical protein
MAYFSRRLPGVLTRADLVRLVTPTYAKGRGVDEEEAAERVGRALAAPAALDDLYRGLSAGLEAAKGPRTSEDALVDKLSAAVPARRARAKPAPDTPGISAVLVRLDLEIGLTPEATRAMLETPKGRALLEDGLAQLGKHLVKDLLRG